MGFHSFGYQMQAHALGHSNNGDYQAGIIFALVKINDKTSIYLDWQFTTYSRLLRNPRRETFTVLPLGIALTRLTLL